jgi:hypothetical protein
MAPALALIVMLVLGIVSAGAIAIAVLELREVAILRQDLRKAQARAKLAERALSDLRIKRSRAVSKATAPAPPFRPRAGTPPPTRSGATPPSEIAAARACPSNRPAHRIKHERTPLSRMCRGGAPLDARPDQRPRLGLLSGSVPAAGGGDAGHHFAISVPVADADSLLGLRSLSGPVLSPRVDVSVVLVVPSTSIDTRGRRARREVTVHVKGNA